MLSIIALGVRALQLLLGVVILGLSVTLTKQQVFGDAPTTFKYSTFTGALAAIVALLGAAMTFFERIPGLVPMAMDAVTGLLLLGGGIAWAIGLKGINCHADLSDDSFNALNGNGLLNQGSVTANGETGTGVEVGTSDPATIYSRLQGNCSKGFADEVIQFVSFAICVALIALSFFVMRKGGGRSRPTFVA